MIWYGPAKNNGLETCSAVALRASAAGCGCGTSQRTNLGQGERTWLRVLPVVPHKAVAEVSKIGNLKERLVVVNRRWQSEATDGPKGA